MKVPPFTIKNDFEPLPSAEQLIAQARCAAARERLKTGIQEFGRSMQLLAESVRGAGAVFLSARIPLLHLHRILRRRRLQERIITKAMRYHARHARRAVARRRGGI